MDIESRAKIDEVSRCGDDEGYRYLGKVAKEKVAEFYAKVAGGVAIRRKEFERQQAEGRKKYHDFVVN